MTQASGSGEMTGKEGASEWEKKGFEPLRFKPGMVQFKVSVTLRHRGDSTPAIFANKDDRMLSLQKTKAEAEAAAEERPPSACCYQREVQLVMTYGWASLADKMTNPWLPS